MTSKRKSTKRRSRKDIFTKIKCSTITDEEECIKHSKCKWDNNKCSTKNIIWGPNNIQQYYIEPTIIDKVNILYNDIKSYINTNNNLNSINYSVDNRKIIKYILPDTFNSLKTEFDTLIAKKENYNNEYIQPLINLNENIKSFKSNLKKDETEEKTKIKNNIKIENNTINKTNIDTIKSFEDEYKNYLSKFEEPINKIKTELNNEIEIFNKKVIKGINDATAKAKVKIEALDKKQIIFI